MVDNVLAETNGLENLGSGVAGKKGDTDLTHDLEKTAVNALPEVLEGSLNGDVRDLAALHLGLGLGGVVPRADSLERNIGVDSAGACAHAGQLAAG